jgi:hypothetical protein
VVKADNSQSRGCGFEPRRRILDEMQAKLAIALKIKVAKWGTLKKYFKKSFPKRFSKKFKLIILINTAFVVFLNSPCPKMGIPHVLEGAPRIVRKYYSGMGHGKVRLG